MKPVEQLTPESYEEHMRALVKSEGWDSVYLCLNIRMDTGELDSDVKLLKTAKEFFCHHGVRYNPFNFSIDAIAPEGINVGVNIHVGDFDRVLEGEQMQITIAKKDGRSYRGDTWMGRELKFDYRPGSGGEGTLIMNR